MVPSTVFRELRSGVQAHLAEVEEALTIRELQQADEVEESRAIRELRQVRIQELQLGRDSLLSVELEIAAREDTEREFMSKASAARRDLLGRMVIANVTLLAGLGAIFVVFFAGGGTISNFAQGSVVAFGAVTVALSLASSVFTSMERGRWREQSRAHYDAIREFLRWGREVQDRITFQLRMSGAIE